MLVQSEGFLKHGLHLFELHLLYKLVGCDLQPFNVSIEASSKARFWQACCPHWRNIFRVRIGSSGTYPRIRQIGSRKLWLSYLADADSARTCICFAPCKAKSFASCRAHRRGLQSCLRWFLEIREYLILMQRVIDMIIDPYLPIVLKALRNPVFSRFYTTHELLLLLWLSQGIEGSFRRAIKFRLCQTLLFFNWMFRSEIFKLW